MLELFLSQLSNVIYCYKIKDKFDIFSSENLKLESEKCEKNNQICLVYFNLKVSSSAFVSTKYGPVEGTIRTSDLSRYYFSFQVIPYARPSVLNL